jgi:hypothetical protein
MMHVSVQRKAVRSAALDYFGTSQKFAFICNRAMDGRPWTPGRLKRKLRGVSFKNLLYVVAFVSATNLDAIMQIVEEWNAEQFRVVLVFPIHRNIPTVTTDEDHAFGVPVAECYDPTLNGGFTATPAFREEVAGFFADDKDVIVEV